MENKDSNTKVIVLSVLLVFSLITTAVLGYLYLNDEEEVGERTQDNTNVVQEDDNNSNNDMSNGEEEEASEEYEPETPEEGLPENPPQETTEFVVNEDGDYILEDNGWEVTSSYTTTRALDTDQYEQLVGIWLIPEETFYTLENGDNSFTFINNLPAPGTMGYGPQRVPEEFEAVREIEGTSYTLMSAEVDGQTEYKVGRYNEAFGDTSVENANFPSIEYFDDRSNIRFVVESGDDLDLIEDKIVDMFTSDNSGYFPNVE